jgi:small subunit ribosomal protein S16
MLTIRFFRIGKKNQPSYKIVVTDKKNSPSGGRFTEEVGFYNPITKEKSLNGERIKYWISKGAQPSDTAHNIFVKEGIIEGKKISVLKKSKKKKEEVPAEGIKPEASKEEVKPEKAEIDKKE